MVLGMTPSPEKNEISGTLNKRMINLNSVERTTEKYSGFYSMGKNIRTTKNANKNERENEDDRSGLENDNDDDTDDDFEIGGLNLSNHDINDDDEVLQGVSYLTPPNKNLTRVKNFPKNIIKSNTKNSVKIPNKNLTPKGTVFADYKSPIAQYSKQNCLSLKTVKTPSKRHLIEKREGHDKREKLNDDKNGVSCAFMDAVKSDEMMEMTAQIKALTSELKYFEELTGKRCIFETKVRNTLIHGHTYMHTYHYDYQTHTHNRQTVVEVKKDKHEISCRMRYKLKNCNNVTINYV